MNFGQAFEQVKQGKGMRLPQWKEDVVIRCAFPPDMKDTRAGIAHAICTDVCLALNKELTEAQESTIRAAVRKSNWRANDSPISLCGEPLRACAVEGDHD